MSPARKSNPDPWADDDETMQDSFDDLLFAEERQAWAKRRRCRHCYVWMHDASTNEFAIVCAHGCGSIRHKWRSVDVPGDMKRMKATQEAFMIAHAHGGCPRDTSRLPKDSRRFGGYFPPRKSGG